MVFPEPVDKNQTWRVFPLSEAMSFTLGKFQEDSGYERLIIERRPSWVRMAASILRDNSEAEDLVQETLALLWERRGRLKIENPAGYISRAVWLNALKRRTRRRVYLPLEEAGEIPVEETQEPDWGRISPLDLERAVECLPEAQRSVIRMRYYAGLSFKEIGRALRISLNTAGSRCRYAVNFLRQALGSGHSRGRR